MAEARYASGEVVSAALRLGMEKEWEDGLVTLETCQPGGEMEGTEDGRRSFTGSITGEMANNLNTDELASAQRDLLKELARISTETGEPISISMDSTAEGVASLVMQVKDSNGQTQIWSYSGQKEGLTAQDLLPKEQLPGTKTALVFERAMTDGGLVFSVANEGEAGQEQQVEPEVEVSTFVLNQEAFEQGSIGGFTLHEQDGGASRWQRRKNS